MVVCGGGKRTGIGGLGWMGDRRRRRRWEASRYMLAVKWHGGDVQRHGIVGMAWKSGCVLR